MFFQNHFKFLKDFNFYKYFRTSKRRNRICWIPHIESIFLIVFLTETINLAIVIQTTNQLIILVVELKVSVEFYIIKLNSILNLHRFKHFKKFKQKHQKQPYVLKKQEIAIIWLIILWLKLLNLESSWKPQTIYWFFHIKYGFFIYITLKNFIENEVLMCKFFYLFYNVLID